MTQIDRREEIMVRLVTEFKALPGIATITRNRGELSNDKLPAIMLFDSDEHSLLGLDAPSPGSFPRGRPTGLPDLIRYQPEIFFQITPALHDQTVGTSLNDWRRKIIKAVYTSAPLQQIVGANGAIRYQGCVTDLGRGRSMKGAAQFIFTFVYALIPVEL